MGNQFINLPVPAGNGVGTPVDFSTAGAIKTIVCGGNATATIQVEINNAAVNTAGSWQAVASFQNTGQITIRTACRWMRVRVSGYNPYAGGTPQVDIGCTDDGAQFASLTVPTGNGAGAGTNTSVLGLFKTVQVGGEFRGTLIVEVSEDGATWAQPFSFQTPGAQSAVVAAEFMRVRRVGVPIVSPGQPIVNVGATDDFQGDDGVAISAGSQSVATGTVKFANSNGISFGMSASSQITASMDAFRQISAGNTNAGGSGLSFSNGSNVSFGIVGQTITASVANPGNFQVSAGTTNIAGTGISFSNGSNVTFGLNGSTVTASVANPGLLGASAGTQLQTAGTLSFVDSNGVSFGLSNSSQLTATFAAIKSMSAGTTNATGQGISFSNGSNVSWGVNGNTITASVADPGILAASAGTQLQTSGTLSFANSNGISFGLSGSSRLTASYPSYVSQWYQNTEAGISYGVSVNTMSFWPVSIAEHISATQLAFGVSMNLNSGSTGAWTHSFGIYTLSGVSASLASSTSRQFSFTSGSDTTANSIFAGASGLRYRTLGGNFNLTPGVYLFGMHIQTSGGNSVSLSLIGNGIQAMTGSYDGVETNMWLGGISNSSFTTAMPASVAVTNTNYQRTAVGLRGPSLWMFGTT